MSSKNYGPAVSGYLDPTGRNWENPVFQSGKPVLDRELNLAEDLSSGFGQAALRRLMPSGWISDDFTLSSDMASAIFSPSPIANTLEIPNGLVAHVNGWLLDVSYTGSTTLNALTLPAPPTGAGAMRTDFVVLEVWRRLISASGADGKSPLGRIWRSGNVKITTDAAPYTLDDDILDPNVGSETTKRVQIQYRLRVVEGIDVAAYPRGMEDPLVVAHTVPASAGAPDGTPTSYSYVNQSASGDGGLWVAGDGTLTAQTALGTVDGFMYAIPLMAVFRRNSTAFDRVTNHNGGVPTPGPSDRPDGLFSDVVVGRDIYDLRTGVSPTGWDYREVLSKNFTYLLDNAIRTEVGPTFPVGGGNFGHSVLVADEIGLLPGAPPLTGDTPGANFIGQFDNVRRYFTDRPNVEVVSLAISRSGGGNWVAGDVIQIDPTALPLYPSGPFDWSSRNPYVTLWADVLNPRFVGEASGKRTNVAVLSSIENLSSYPLVPLEIKLGAIPPTTTDERLFIDLVIEYPSGLGLSHTPTETYVPGSLQINNPAALPGYASNPSFDPAHREVNLSYVTSSSLVITQMAEPTPGATSFRLPEVAAGVSNVQKNGSLVSWSLDYTDGRTVYLDSTTTNPTDVLSVTYLPLRPLPAGSVQVTLYYEARVPQTAREALLGTTLQVYPRYIDENLYVLTVGSSSPDEAYPFPSAYVQLGGISTPVSPFLGDHELSASSGIYTAVFNADTGLLRLPSHIPYTPNTEEVGFTRIPGAVDAEGRTFFPEANYTPPAYLPNAYAAPLTGPQRHRNVLPMLAELAVDGPLGPKGQLVMVLLIREALFDADNSVVFDLDPLANTTVASVFRIKGNLLSKKA